MTEPKKQSSSRNSAAESQKEAPRTGKNLLEWAVFALSSVLVTTVFGWLIFQELRGNASPPRLEITLGTPVKAGKRLLIPIEVENHGGKTASGVSIEITRKHSDETATLTLPHVPRNASREGWVAFDAPVQIEELEAKVLGYEEL